ncbi:uncharacterized protein L3040_000330 [Drepanopeziza brunnea f. sp. 'multigermtubi']|uniref:Uncharacterized protein n=1 Tax=Marssonina brunnea f. sp. multigermtubi (strain MB_m1) TaxID=1072389 RepID=K1WJ46_MARBU|nr:uncharacterized protein MBM_09523 [Drepanopeziza brunnea f. sp. 'multigermtubi' MB_m1]EKD12202.1 hypothetical protein MBM_09523 [Drepanopeziza brunnea f. sp. 'multigermtubi' MB_m1]KAJ5054045.1 hypothetical protein L3040_000330 [Drepanopeziza brunnea f. sp. 'multigermtubi']
MMLLSQSTCAILLAWSFLSNRAHGREIIAYRTVSRAEAEYINENERPFRDRELDLRSEEHNQLGQGFYTVNEPGGWPNVGPQWHCAIAADGEKVKAVRKVWIPEYYWTTRRVGRKSKSKSTRERVQLWTYESKNEAAILRYIESLGVPHPERAWRLALVPSLSASVKLQMVIPTETINGNELDFWARCWETRAELLASQPQPQPVDWMSWEGIAGDPEPVDPESSDSSSEEREARWYQRWLDWWQRS